MQVSEHPAVFQKIRLGFGAHGPVAPIRDIVGRPARSSRVRRLRRREFGGCLNNCRAQRRARVGACRRRALWLRRAASTWLVHVAVGLWTRWTAWPNWGSPRPYIVSEQQGRFSEVSTANGIVTGTAENVTVTMMPSGPGKTMTNGGVEAGGKIATGKRTQVRATRLGGRKSTQLRDRSSEQKPLRRRQED